MIHTNSITNAIYTILSSNSTMVNCGVFTSLYEFSDSKPGKVPWVGVVPDDSGLEIGYEPRRANIIEPWMAQLTVPIILRHGSRTKKTGMQKLDELQSIVMSAVNCYDGGQRTLMDTVDIIIGYTVSPFQREELEGLYFMRQLNIIAEALT